MESQLQELAAFVAVVDAQGFRAAARATQARKATLSKRVSELEDRLGVSLLVRTTRSLRLTEEGRAYYDHASRALAAARDAEAAVVSAKEQPRGLLRVTTSRTLAGLILDGVAAAYLARYPEVRLDVHTSEQRSDLIREGFDLAIWSGALADSQLTVRQLGVAEGGYYASPTYLSRRSMPQRPEDLATHDTIIVPKGGDDRWAFIVKGKRKRFAVRARLVVTDVDLAIQAAVAGIGIVRAPLQGARAHLQKNELVQVLGASTPPGLVVNAVFPAGGKRVAKTKEFCDLLEAWFADDRRVSAADSLRGRRPQ